MTASQDPVVFDTRPTADDHLLGIARLNQPRSLNALSLDMIRLLHKQLSRWAEDDRIVAVWLEGSGEKAFCAGGDIVALYKAMTGDNENSLDAGVAFFTEEYQLDYQIHDYPKPIIAWGHGVVMGGGIGLFVGASHRIVTETARIAMPESSIGLYPDVGASWFLNRMPGRTGLFLGITGASMNAADALYVGLADHYIEQGQREALLEAICQSEALAAHPRATIDEACAEMAKLALRSLPESPLCSARDEIDELTDATELKAVTQQLAGYSGEATILQKAAEAVRKASPTSMAIFWRQWQRAAHEDLETVFQQELQLSIRCLQLGEFAEGVRALLIDKDKNPKWRYQTVAELEPEWIDRFFATA
ncbi:enoyl-CoA hydratase/isomerase family protein [Allohahella marinimesophila]|uniref:3-hydroxyisobutyryl-CoA hydrolase n=1 Tax=Allohahella marinimesophila TaxID=1054972 RepID=A0ABP7PQA6_9GAMM